VSSRRQTHRPGKPFSSLVAGIPGALTAGSTSVAVTGLAYDSRRVEAGDAFVCVRGEQTDGHCFAADAVARGASAIVAESGRQHAVDLPPGGALAIVPDTRAAMAAIACRFYDDPSARLTLAGVTGTNGKTTTALMLDAIFRAAGHSTGLIGTIEYRIGERRVEPPHTTPEAIDLQRILAEMVAGGASHAAMEVSSHALALHRADGCRFAAAVFTNLTPEHLDFHENMDAYLEVKRRLFEDPEFLPASGQRCNAINIDDEAGRTIAVSARGRTLTYGLAAGADCRAEDLDLAVDGTRLIVAHPAGSLPLRLRLLGQFNVYNALGALSAAIGLGIDPAVAAAALEEMAPVQGRFEHVPSKTRTVLVDYAHSPDGLERALETARRLTRGRVIVVFGCGGDRDSTKRPVMGEIAGRLADRCVVTSDNPRSESPQAIVDQIFAGIAPQDRRHCSAEVDRAAAIRMALEQARPEDLVLIAGKGHETYQIFADRTVDFDDREVALRALREIEGDRDA